MRLSNQTSSGRRRRRRAADAPVAALPLEREEARLYTGFGTHYVYLEVGSPSQAVSVMVDTGSHLTAFPCSPRCEGCGEHTDAYFSPAASSTFEWLDCGECPAEGSCDEAGCALEQAYAEGSSWRGRAARDTVQVGGARLPLSFTCVSRETGLLVSQRANGVVGLSRRALGTSFALCLTPDGGAFSLGGVDTRRHDEPMRFTALSGWPYYTVALADVEIAGRSIGASPSDFASGKGAVVDSGTTDTYLPRALADAFAATWRLAVGAEYDVASGYLRPLPFPDVVFVFADGLRVRLAPEAYLVRKGARLLPRIHLDAPTGAVLGANFMLHRDVYFDPDNRRIGFAPSSSCASFASGSAARAQNRTVRPRHFLFADDLRRLASSASGAAADLTDDSFAPWAAFLASLAFVLALLLLGTFRRSSALRTS